MSEIGVEVGLGSRIGIMIKVMAKSRMRFGIKSIGVRDRNLIWGFASGF